MTSGEEDIEASLRILLSTAVGERFLQPKYGCNLEHLLFEQLTTSVKTYVRGLIEGALLLYEPRVDLESVDFVTEGEAEGRLDIVIGYVVRTTNSRYNLVYPLYRP